MYLGLKTLDFTKVTYTVLQYSVPHKIHSRVCYKSIDHIPATNDLTLETDLWIRQ